ncbi:MAG: helix-turn-helix domain-containing protein, partial [Solirubrobacteraceae bacterium]
MKVAGDVQDLHAIKEQPQERLHRKLLRQEIRSRAGHDNRTLIRLINIEQAGQQLQLPVRTIQLAVSEGFIPHYHIQGHLRFDPVDLGRWVRDHRIDEFTPTLVPGDECWT